ncbi:MAG TPA: hypothetical protein VH165_19150 [Kofleriaceae bacterium]|jgi:hypothetical protein|nr:hypothetical protein [Kofleriaceae bacterium]
MATACLTETRDNEVPTNGTDGTDAGSGSGSDSLVALVVPTPRDHNLEYMVGLTSMAVVIIPSLRRKRRHDATRTA